MRRTDWQERNAYFFVVLFVPSCLRGYFRFFAAPLKPFFFEKKNQKTFTLQACGFHMRADELDALLRDGENETPE